MASLIYFIITLSILVTVHEYGHYRVARLCKVKVLVFSVGFGRELWSYTSKSGTRFCLAAIPLGGYVRMLDEREAEVPEAIKSQAFNNKSLTARAAIVSAGPIANFMLAVLVYWVVFVVGVPGIKPVIGNVQSDSPAAVAGVRAGDVIVAIDGKEVVSRADVQLALARRLGDSGELQFEMQAQNGNFATTHHILIDRWLEHQSVPDYQQALGFSFWRPLLPAIIDSVAQGQPAERAGLRGGDQILAINNEPVADWYVFADKLQQYIGQYVALEVLRQQESETIQVEVARVALDDGSFTGRIGVMAQAPVIPDDMLVERRWSVFAAFYRAIAETADMTAFTLISIKKMLVGMMSASNLSGPVTIAKIASASASSGAVAYLQFLGLLSVSLAVLNLLPIPVLDGGHLVMLGCEALRGKALSEKTQMRFQQFGLILIFSLMTLALYNDMTRL